MALTPSPSSAEVKGRVELYLLSPPLWAFVPYSRENLTFTLPLPIGPIFKRQAVLVVLGVLMAWSVIKKTVAYLHLSCDLLRNLLHGAFVTE